ncbi:MAG: DNA repair protein RecN [Xylanivirga thermophila]|uniref:DNA repair protein RecN n=1 Tax=Xylanivirga thermophila TaxID=2496273 RepID=UPI0013EDB8E6|nr:DNA repair protein RecN [Xylanivirga thermophila]
MLSHLSIENLALIDELTVEWRSGLNIITGETGAGKSIIIDAISLVLGGRADRELIRSGADFTRVEAVFYVEYHDKISIILDQWGIGIEQDGMLILMRKLHTNGRNVCRINGHAVTVSTLKEVGKCLIDIHGQHEHQSLLSPEYQLDVLDALGGKDILMLKKQLSSCYNQWKAIKNDIDKILGDERDLERKKDLLIYQINEIESARLVESEEEELEHEKLILQNAEKIVNGVEKIYSLLYSGDSHYAAVYDQLGAISNLLFDIAQLDDKLKNISQQIDDLYYNIEDIVEKVRTYKDSFSYDPQRLEQVENRLDLIRQLKRKYGSSIKEILVYKAKIQKELSYVENSKETLEELKRQEKDLYIKLVNYCSELSHKRMQLAEKFKQDMHRQLIDLGMDKARFDILISHPEDINDSHIYISENGYDKVEFLISPNIGEPLKPLNKIASGGELSRMMLAFKTISANVDDIPTLIFDEIDVGISGQIAQVVAQKMASISRYHQLICITHLPQIAAMADNHFCVSKNLEKGRTITTVNFLQPEEQKKELAKMIDGTDITEISLRHASEMINQAKNFKDK